MSTKLPLSILNNSNGLHDAPNDGKDYVLKDGQWEDVDALGLRYIKDAPADGNTYRRRNGAWVPADPKSNISTHSMTDHCIGIEMAYSGGGSGTWVNINKDGKYVRTSPTYFNNHPVWGAIKDEIVDGQHMVRIPKFYYKNIEHRQIWISDTKLDDSFKVHPAFMNNGVEQECFWIGKYHASLDGTKLCSLPNNTPVTGVAPSNYFAYANNRNVDGVTGFDVLNIYQVGAVIMLFMIEYCTTDYNLVIGPGPSVTTNTTAQANLLSDYRGIISLVGNVWTIINGMRYQPFEIWDSHGNKTWVPTNLTFNSVSGRYFSKMLDNVTDEYDLTSVFLPDFSVSATRDESSWGHCNWYNDGNGYYYNMFGRDGSTDNCGLFHQWGRYSASSGGNGTRLSKM